MQRLTFKQILCHLRTVRTHRKWVRHYCFLAGIPWRGLVHDLSKYSPTEFLESARFWTGKNSPIEEAKKYQGYSKAWLHHRGRNPHHWAYWADNFSEGLTIYPMERDDFVEMICDFLAAGRAYNGRLFSYTGERNWWIKEKESGCKAMHPENKLMCDIIFSDLEVAENPMYAGLDRCQVQTPEKLIKSGYIQEVWRANHDKNIHRWK